MTPAPRTEAGRALRGEYPGVWYWEDPRWDGPLGAAIEAEAARLAVKGVAERLPDIIAKVLPVPTMLDVDFADNIANDILALLSPAETLPAAENCRICDLTYPAGTEHRCTDGWTDERQAGLREAREYLAWAEADVPPGRTFEDWHDKGTVLLRAALSVAPVPAQEERL